MTCILKPAIAAIMLLLLSGYCTAQKPAEPKRTLQIIIPGILRVAPVQSDIIDWTRQHGGSAAPDTYAIEYFNICAIDQRGFIVGFAVGGIYSPVHKSSISTGYGDFILGARIFSDKFFQVNTLGHLDYLQYNITGMPSPN